MIFKDVDRIEIENVYIGDTVRLIVSKENFIDILLQRANNIGCKLIQTNHNEFHFKDSRFLERQSNIDEILG